MRLRCVAVFSSSETTKLVDLGVQKPPDSLQLGPGDPSHGSQDSPGQVGLHPDDGLDDGVLGVNDVPRYPGQRTEVSLGSSDSRYQIVFLETGGRGGGGGGLVDNSQHHHQHQYDLADWRHFSKML